MTLSEILCGQQYKRHIWPSMPEFIIQAGVRTGKGKSLNKFSKDSLNDNPVCLADRD
jgi:hypothetical protein